MNGAKNQCPGYFAGMNRYQFNGIALLSILASIQNTAI